MTTYLLHRISCTPRAWKEVADALASTASGALSPLGGELYGIWRSQIGRPRDELNVITSWAQLPADRATSTSTEAWFSPISGIAEVETRSMSVTLRPTDATPPHRQGNYAFRYFSLPAGNWNEFLDLCEAAWADFEASYNSQVIGLWRIETSDHETRESLLLTRRPNLAMWERSKLPEGEREAEVRRKLSRRYDLCDQTYVFTTTLLTATDADDDARWT